MIKVYENTTDHLTDLFNVTSLVKNHYFQTRVGSWGPTWKLWPELSEGVKNRKMQMVHRTDHMIQRELICELEHAKYATSIPHGSTEKEGADEVICVSGLWEKDDSKVASLENANASGYLKATGGRRRRRMRKGGKDWLTSRQLTAVIQMLL